MILEAPRGAALTPIPVAPRKAALRLARAPAPAGVWTRGLRVGDGVSRILAGKSEVLGRDRRKKNAGRP